VDHRTRIDDLRRRVEKDPASIAFAQLAEEYRRAGDLHEAVRVCETGLAQHPAYISARVTLGRSLFDLGRLAEARQAFTQVIEAAPDNLIARDKLLEIEQLTRPMPAVTLDRPPRPARPSADPVLAELQAWLDVIAERRLARSH
jgi:tetratricopeptide (TPR) repeat protein